MKLKLTSAKITLLIIVVFTSGIKLRGQESTIIKIWPGEPLYNLTSGNMEKAELGDDGVTRYYNITIPSLEYFKPEKPNGTAVIICPGGGYARIAYTNEGIAMAKWFAELGISAFILKYRIPDDKFMEHKERAPLSDAQQAILYLRENSNKLGIRPDKIGIIGFSAGGHLAATLSTHFTESIIPNDNKINLRPDFSILIYPVITMEKDYTHPGSRENLLGDNPSDQFIREFSNEKCVTDKTPPTFLVHASDDHSVPVENSLHYYEALKNHNVIAVLHIFQKGGHGFAMKNEWNDKQWLYLLENWLIENKII